MAIFKAVDFEALGVEEEKPQTWRNFLSEGLPKDEKGLAQRVVKVLDLEGWTIYQEVALGRMMTDYEQRRRLEGRRFPWQAVCDIVAVRGPLVMAVEVKKSFSLQLIEQAISWTRIFPLVAMAVPYVNVASNHTGVREHLRTYHGIGLCAISSNGVRWPHTPRLLRHNLSVVPDIVSVLQPAMATISEAGSAHTYRLTPYQQTMRTVRWLLASKGPMRICDIARYLDESDSYHWSSPASMKSGLSAAINVNESDFEKDGKLVKWVREKCPHGVRYVADIMQCVNQ